MKRRYASKNRLQSSPLRIAASPTNRPPPIQIWGLTSADIFASRASETARTVPSSVSPPGLLWMKETDGECASRMKANGMMEIESADIFARRAIVSRERGEAYELSTELDIA